ncbi:protein CDV3 homolog A-like [Tubulanus polymorphus]|uniref:protein CDV3 homolog A-like n=1 Tax=Tubulanus polymorphus TaxID=672921 RepID=UPI003DA4349F
MTDTALLDDFFAKKDKTKKKSKFNSKKVMGTSKKQQPAASSISDDLIPIGTDDGSRPTTGNMPTSHRANPESTHLTSPEGETRLGLSSELGDNFTTPDVKHKTTGGSSTTTGTTDNGWKEKKKKKKDNDDESSARYSRKDDAEWNDFEEEDTKDYSGLRIQNLQFRDEDDSEEKEIAGQNENDLENGGDAEAREKESGPWRLTVETTNQPLETDSDVPVPATREEAVVLSGKYVPPAARFAGSMKTSSNTPGKRGKRGAPCIKSEVDFPSLGGSVEDANMRKEKDTGYNRYESVKSGNRLTQESDRSLKLELGNKFSALTKND